jgi:hypothetical protein
MKRPIPEWLSTLAWFVASIFATGAVWFYLGKEDYLATGLSVLGAVTIAVVAIVLQRLNDRSARFRVVRNQLSEFIKQAESLLHRQNEMPLPIKDHNDWTAAVEAYLRSTLDQSYVVRFGNFSGMTFFSDGSERATYRNSLDGRVRRLNEFIQEFRE